MASKEASEEAVKKPAEKTTQPKAMDIHPVGTAPTIAGGRQILVGNKVMATDPMLSATKSQETIEKPQDESGAITATTAPVVNRHVKTISPISTEETDQPLEQENDAVAKSVEAVTAAKTNAEDDVVAKDTEVTDDATEDNEAATKKSAESVASEEAKAEPKEVTKEPSTEDTAEGEPTDGAIPVEEDTGPQEKTAEQMREDQLESFIQTKTYAVPIDKTGHRRHNAVLALLLVLVALVVTLNFLLDFGVITIPGAPSTDIVAPKSQ